MGSLVDEAYLPATRTVGPMTDEAFSQLCSEHPNLNLELSARGELIVMPQAFTLTGARNGEISGQLSNWARQDKRGVAFDSSTGWLLPNTARRSPDAAWILKQRIKELDPAAFSQYWPICPNFVIELRSQTDRIRVLRDKMEEWLANGAKLAWLIDAESRTVEIYRPGFEAETRANISSIAGEGPVEGFILDLLPVWDPLDANISPSRPSRRSYLIPSTVSPPTPDSKITPAHSCILRPCPTPDGCGHSR